MTYVRNRECLYISVAYDIMYCISYTLPILSYGLNVLFLPRSQLIKLNSCWNSIYRKIFGYFKWKSVKEIQSFCQRLDFVHVVDE